MTRSRFFLWRLPAWGLTCLALGAWGCAALEPAAEPLAGAGRNDPQTEFAAGQWAEQKHDWNAAAEAYGRGLRTDPDALALWRARAGMLMQTDRAGQAEEEFRDALKKHADDPAWIFLMGEIADAAGDSPSAETHYRRAAASAQPTAGMFTALGLFLLDQDREPQARVFLDKALSLDPHERRARLAELEAAIDREDYARARGVLNAALAADPGDEEWLFRLGKVYELEGEETQALKTYQRLLRDDPENPEARRALAEIYLQDRNYAQALPWLEAMQRSDPQDALVKRNLGAAYFELGQWDAARPLLNELEDRQQADALTHFMLGAIYRRKSLWRLAEQELTMAREAPELRLDAGLELAGVDIELGESSQAEALLSSLRPKLDDSAPRLLRCALAYLRLDQPARAIEALQRALTLAPRDAALHFHLGRGFLAQKKIPAALQAWQAAVRLDPKLAEAYNHLAYTCAEGHFRLPEAEAWARRAVSLESGNGNFRDTLGWVYFQEKKYAPALEELLRALAALQAHPEDADPVVYEHLGDAYDQLNRADEAVHAWEQALAHKPQDAGLLEKIKRRRPAGK
jgi:cellulose synthase operon protein C